MFKECYHSKYLNQVIIIENDKFFDIFFFNDFIQKFAKVNLITITPFFIIHKAISFINSTLQIIQYIF